MGTSLQQIESVINRQIDYADRQAAEQKINDCINVIGISAKLKAQTAGNLERAKAKVYRDNQALNSRMLKMLIDAETAAEQESYILAERLNVSLFKTIDGLKAVLSIQTEDLKW